MFHYRWTYDIETAGFNIGRDILGRFSSVVQMENGGASFARRQVARLRDVVGSNEVTGPVIEQSFRRLCSLLEAHFHAGHNFLLGSRPSAADFALFGQLHPMVSLDVETSRRVFAASRSVFFWYHSLKDLSGQSIEDEAAGWVEPSALPPTLKALLAEVGRLYAPFMVANAEAVAASKREFECWLDGGTVKWHQASFKYQAKCLHWLRDGYKALSQNERQVVNTMLNGTGCLEMLQESSTDQSRL
jgi:hypothetical protein